MVICNRTYFGGWLFSCQTTLIIKESNNYEMENILMDLGYTKTRHHDKYVKGSQKRKNIQPFWNEEMHRRCMACIFDFGLKGIGRVWINDCIEASPKVIYPALKEYSMSLRPENIKSHLQKYRSNSKANQLEYIHFFERYLRKVETKFFASRFQKASEGQFQNSSYVTSQQGLPSGAVSQHSYPSVVFSSIPNSTSSLSAVPVTPGPGSAGGQHSNHVETVFPGLSVSALSVSATDEDEERGHNVYFCKDPSMDYQVNLHDDIISKHSIRQQRMGLDGIDNDNRYTPNPDYDSFFATASAIEADKPLVLEDEAGNPLNFLQEPDN
ncbi:hypothetical protein JH06_0529 [Blastocystis sp. subtype 4]|uniref:hypothetical protein n=1 Tax=Blastocystis sp. subtype 4 TaxID=944170 RepID=UPI0007118B88|nr:hypothetical protein JH06_0529 [Blastocystis sp. subtype 4]KNB45853.1 hypothetical protein JH06_0529 [Blastocystis sp. subtype 4]|eukprot:XP_014529296.1 hypothetical protein JH06_0529 [Blastocystis sp. subtype 4]